MIYYASYQEYLKSPHWFNLRKATYARAKRKCEACRRGGKMHAHHTIYRHPLESGTVDDLLALCEACHAKWHQWAEGRSYFTPQKTIEILRSIRAPKAAKKSGKKKQVSKKKWKPLPAWKRDRLFCRAIDNVRLANKSVDWEAELLRRNQERHRKVV